MTAVFLVLLILLIAVNGIFVAAEFALVRSRRTRIEQLASEGARGASTVLEELDRIDEYLSACQLGITMASIGIGFLGEPAIARLLEKAFGDGVPHAVSTGGSVTIAYVIVTSLHITAGEQVPKIYSITHAEGTVRRTAHVLEIFRAWFKPFIWALTRASNAMLRLVGVDATAEFEDEPRSEALKMLIARGVTGGTLGPGE